MAAAFSMQPLSLRKIQKDSLCSEAKKIVLVLEANSVGPATLSMRKGVESVPSAHTQMTNL